jgi:hypothetical protein
MTRYHRAGCALLAGKQTAPVSMARAEAKGKRPCGICAP